MSALQQTPIVFIRSGPSFRWVTLNGCVWKAPRQLRSIPALEQHFPKLETLFVRYLGVQNASIANIVDELLRLEGQTSEVADIKGLLEALNACLTWGNDDPSIDRLRNARVFPTRISTSEERLESCASDQWCIADRSSLRYSFVDELHLLNFDVKDTKVGGRLQPLLERINLVDRRLSGKVEEKTESGGLVELDKETTAELRYKAKYIARLLPRENRHSMLEKLSHMKVFCTENLTLRRSVIIGDSAVISDGDGQVLMSTGLDGNACMYLKFQDVESGELPVWQMLNELLNYFDMPNTQSHLLSSVLGMKNDKQIEDMLEQNGFDKDDDGVG
ncbi:MAG: hypothetical protein M1822_005460 [Bathelium mastoideum]|nr:MAG: hypothetical protein M1822_005460 [Bathelium mastoideum]